ncbi:uncharacterized protein BO97DRAFT_126403 [Aspergillus homomorphus CBS 101889]|uniref:Uncharacterized protein n=1 Tax=Aspergillus homomorphus (strain CBS 101889) TaxID=1450537 RepID=A0A395HSX5_ASPHC|nr:hypothetical protein BO97DRAFT_126403 [Aspergillus homomorphus CBS 101889]RAL10455.1 hypothetical protein BO97DRAFT_126403 [Aspergillus homomorphus CBS 101889]
MIWHEVAALVSVWTTHRNRFLLSERRMFASTLGNGRVYLGVILFFFCLWVQHGMALTVSFFMVMYTCGKALA